MSTSDDELRRMLEQTLVPPLGVTELDPNSVKRTTSRLGAAQGSVSELYHLNSGLTPAGVARLLPEPSVKTVKDFYFNTAMEGAKEMERQQSGNITDLRSVAPELEQVLVPCWSVPYVVPALFAVDVLVVAGGKLWKQVPGAPRLIFESMWSDEQTVELSEAMPGSPSLTGPDRALIFIVGAFARTGFVQGDRTYRTTGLSAGIVAGALMQACFGPPPTWRPVLVENFVDTDVNRLLRNDGTDRGAVSVLALSKVPMQQSASSPAQGVDGMVVTK
jgi:hypothetical protein